MISQSHFFPSSFVNIFDSFNKLSVCRFPSNKCRIFFFFRPARSVALPVMFGSSPLLLVDDPIESKRDLSNNLILCNFKLSDDSISLLNKCEFEIAEKRKIVGKFEFCK